ncbi:MAG: 16S rRNA (uracil(1498)-N(3))-methyltransferase [Lachnospiraceae bacterium]
MQRFFVEKSQIEGNYIRITGSDMNHIKNVLRMKLKDTLQVCDDAQMEYSCYIEAMKPEEILLHIQYAQEQGAELSSSILLFQALPKADKMEFIIQKAVELGAERIQPMRTRRCVVKLDETKAQKKQQRWQQISESAAKQAKRGKIPTVGSVMGFSEALQMAAACDIRLIPYEMETNLKETKELLAQIPPGASIAVFIGPEGGFAEEEIEAALQAGVQPITLGRRILRTETAGMMLLSVLMFLLEEE